MPKTILLTLLFSCFGPKIFGQILPVTHIPSALQVLPHINLAEILFSADDLKKLNYKVIRGRMAFSDFQNRVTDTVCLFEFRFNDDFQCTHKVFRDKNSITTIDFQRFPQEGIVIETMKDSTVNGPQTGLRAESERRYQNDLLQKNMEKSYFLDHPSRYLGHEDTLIYNSDNQAVTKIEKYYEIQSGLFADSLIEQRKYNEKGKLVQLTRQPSNTFFQKNTGHHNGYGVKTVCTEPNKTVYQYYFGQKIYVYQAFRSKDEKHEQNGKDERTTIYVGGTDLPLLIKQPSDNSTLFYEFKYAK